MKNGVSRAILSMLAFSFFFFTKDGMCVEPPSSGTMLHGQSSGGVYFMVAQDMSDDRHRIVSLFSESGRGVLSVFVRAYGTARFFIPEGRYVIRESRGKKFDGISGFADGQKFGVSDLKFDAKVDGVRKSRSHVDIVPKRVEAAPKRVDVEPLQSECAKTGDCWKLVPESRYR